LNDDDTIVYRCDPPYAHVTLNGALACECGVRFDEVLAEMLAAHVEIATA